MSKCYFLFEIGKLSSIFHQEFQNLEKKMKNSTESSSTENGVDNKIPLEEENSNYNKTKENFKIKKVFDFHRSADEKKPHVDNKINSNLLNKKRELSKNTSLRKNSKNIIIKKKQEKIISTEVPAPANTYLDRFGLFDIEINKKPSLDKVDSSKIDLISKISLKEKIYPNVENQAKITENKNKSHHSSKKNSHQKKNHSNSKKISSIKNHNHYKSNDNKTKIRNNDKSNDWAKSSNEILPKYDLFTLNKFNKIDSTDKGKSQNIIDTSSTNNIFSLNTLSKLKYNDLNDLLKKDKEGPAKDNLSYNPTIKSLSYENNNNNLSNNKHENNLNTLQSQYIINNNNNNNKINSNNCSHQSLNTFSNYIEEYFLSNKLENRANNEATIKSTISKNQISNENPLWNNNNLKLNNNKKAIRSRRDPIKKFKLLNLIKEDQELLNKGHSNYKSLKNFYQQSLNDSLLENHTIKSQDKRRKFLKSFVEEREFQNHSKLLFSFYSKKQIKIIIDKKIEHNKINYFTINLKTLDGEENTVIASVNLVSNLFQT